MKIYDICGHCHKRTLHEKIPDSTALKCLVCGLIHSAVWADPWS